MQQIVFRKKDCRVCKHTNLSKILTLGPTPLANAFLTKQQKDKEEYFFPLDVYFCKSCTFVQLGHVVSPEVLFMDYVYVSSTSPVFIQHFENFASDVFSQYDLNSKSLVIDIGSNDGILLKPFKKLGVKTLGIEPAEKIAKKAKKDGINTIAKFFSVDLAKRIIKHYGYAKVITATNVFAHIDDLDEVIKGVKILLEDHGMFIIEAPYLIDFIKKRYFDLVYHEHLSYWAIKPLITLLKRFDMEVFDVKKVSVHGGSIRVFVKKKKGKYKITKRVGDFLTQERNSKLSNIETYELYGKKILENKIKLVSLLSKIKTQGKRIGAYGAPAKGNTLLNFFSIGPELIDYVVDDSTWKQGLYSPGKRIPVVSSRKMYENKVDYMLILAWNFAESIMKNHKKFSSSGGRFILPVPQPSIV